MILKTQDSLYSNLKSHSSNIKTQYRYFLIPSFLNLNNMNVYKLIEQLAPPNKTITLGTNQQEITWAIENTKDSIVAHRKDTAIILLIQIVKKQQEQLDDLKFKVADLRGEVEYDEPEIKDEETN